MDTGVTADAMESIIGHIEREVREPITLDKDAVSVKVSIGQALFPEDGTTRSIWSGWRMPECMR